MEVMLFLVVIWQDCLNVLSVVKAEQRALALDWLSSPQLFRVLVRRCHLRHPRQAGQTGLRLSFSLHAPSSEGRAARMARKALLMACEKAGSFAFLGLESL